MNVLCLLAMLLLFLGCANTSLGTNEPSFTITQGIRGKIEIREGNYMPGPTRSGQPAPSPQNPSSTREIFIYEPVNLNQVTGNEGFYSHIGAKLIANVQTAKDGSFQVALKPGKYSLFSKEPKGFYANQFNGEGYIFLVEVKPNQVTPVNFVIDYNASY